MTVATTDTFDTFDTFDTTATSRIYTERPVLPPTSQSPEQETYRTRAGLAARPGTQMVEESVDSSSYSY